MVLVVMELGFGWLCLGIKGHDANKVWSKWIGGAAWAVCCPATYLYCLCLGYVCEIQMCTAKKYKPHTKCPMNDHCYAIRARVKILMDIQETCKLKNLTSQSPFYNENCILHPFNLDSSKTENPSHGHVNGVWTQHFPRLWHGLDKISDDQINSSFCKCDAIVRVILAWVKESMDHCGTHTYISFIQYEYSWLVILCDYKSQNFTQHTLYMLTPIFLLYSDLCILLVALLRCASLIVPA